MLKVKLPDGSARQYNKRVRPIDVAAEIGPGLAKAAILAEVEAYAPSWKRESAGEPLSSLLILGPSAKVC